MWKKRKELPPFRKLNIVFDIEKILNDYHSMTNNMVWNSLSNEYVNLCKNHPNLTPKFNQSGDSNEYLNESSPYIQISLSEFDSDFNLNRRIEKSKTEWDYNIVKNTPIADERFYRKPIDNIPPYLTDVLNYFRPHLHRVRFAKLLAGSEVRKHIDYDTTYGIRIHIPIITNSECIVGFELPDKTIVEQHWPADGSVYFFNPGLPHWVKNNGLVDRVHLVLSVDSQDILNDN